MTVSIERESTEYLYVGLFGQVPQIDQEIAFKKAGVRPEEVDWIEAELVTAESELWGPATTATEGEYFLAVLLGEYDEFTTGGVVLTPGDYVVWLRLTDTIERPVRIVPEALEVR